MAPGAIKEDAHLLLFLQLGPYHYLPQVGKRREEIGSIVYFYVSGRADPMI